MRLRILGDHSGYHAGSAAVFSSLVRMARQKGWKVVGPKSDYDALLVNGEGSMHHSHGRWHRKMQALNEALDQDKQAHLVNTVWQDNSGCYDNTLRNLTSITVREVRSRDDLVSNHGVEARVVPDVSLAEPVGFAWRPIDFNGQPAKTDFYLPDTGKFSPLDDTFRGISVLPFKSMSWSRAIKSLRTASYLITGRQHGVYAACKARIPFVASEGNTHKIRGLIESAGVDIPVADHPEDIPAILPLINERRGEFEKLFDWLEGQDYASVIPNAVLAEHQIP